MGIYSESQITYTGEKGCQKVAEKEWEMKSQRKLKVIKKVKNGT